MKTTKTTTTKAHEYIVSQKKFKASALWGVNINNIQYVVYSYNEPIAYWVSGLGWFVTDTKFSPTTSRHTRICRNALKKYGEISSDEMKKLIRG
jgi:hypothetical protein